MPASRALRAIQLGAPWFAYSGNMADRPRAVGHKSGKTESSQAPATDPQRIDPGAKMTKCQNRSMIAATATMCRCANATAWKKGRYERNPVRDR
jgi:hypothetical protein